MFWRILFWVYIILYLSIIIFSSFEVRWQFVDWLGIVAVCAGLFLLYAYAYNKNYFSKNIRLLIVSIALAYWVAYALYLDPKYGAYPGGSLGDAIFNIIIVLPVFIPAILYARKTVK